MAESLVYQQSRHFEQFQCIAGACEDTCCSGLVVSVDRRTFQKYQACSHPVLRPQLEQWVQIQPAAKDSKDFARIVLEGSSCPFLVENLCFIQSELGEDNLCQVCASFPRVRNKVGSVVERSLDLSCPEAARICLTDPEPATFNLVTLEGDEQDVGAVATENPVPYFNEIRGAILWVLQNRRFPVTKRLILAGHICDKLDELALNGNHDSVPRLLAACRAGIDAGLYDAHLKTCLAGAPLQLTTVLELIMARIKIDFTPQRYLDHYLEFTEGLRLEPGLNIRDCADRYGQAYVDHYLPFVTEHEHMLEHYLVHYAYRTLFPFGSKAIRASLGGDERFGLFAGQFLLMASYFAMTRAMMIGLAARYGSSFGAGHAIRCIQVSSRTLEHSMTYPLAVLNILAGKGVTSAAGMSFLTQDPSNRREHFRALTQEMA